MRNILERVFLIISAVFMLWITYVAYKIGMVR